jgi:hypothetical protein
MRVAIRGPETVYKRVSTTTHLKDLRTPPAQNRFNAGGAIFGHAGPGGVMDMDPPRIRMRRSTALAAKPIAEQNGFPVAAEAGLRAPARPSGKTGSAVAIESAGSGAVPPGREMP